ncbi:MAG: hypothetical protein AB1696_12155 [Planctomycetota bacterium]
MSAHNISNKVPKYGPAIPPVGVLWSALRTEGEAVELGFLTGVTGAAFRTCVNEAMNDEALLAEGNRFAENALPLLGYEIRFLARGFGKGKVNAPEREKIFTLLQVTLDGGTPVLLTGPFGWALVLGYDKGNKQYWIREAAPRNAVHDMALSPPWQAGSEQEERWEDEETLAEMEGGLNLAVLRKRGQRLPDRGLAINALRHAVAHISKKGPGPMHFGLNAITFLRGQLLKEAEESKWEARVLGADLPLQVIFATLNRHKAVEFLKDLAPEFAGEKKSSLGECAAAYAEAAQTWLTLQCSLPNPKAYEEKRESAQASPDSLRSMAELLKQIFEIEERALHLLEGVV